MTKYLKSLTMSLNMVMVASTNDFILKKYITVKAMCSVFITINFHVFLKMLYRKIQ